MYGGNRERRRVPRKSERSGRAAAGCPGVLAASGLLAGVASVVPPPLSALLAWIQRLTGRLIRRHGTLGLVFVLSVPGWPDTVVLYAFGVFGIDRTRFVRSGVEHRRRPVTGRHRSNRGPGGPAGACAEPPLDGRASLEERWGSSVVDVDLDGFDVRPRREDVDEQYHGDQEDQLGFP